MRRVRSEERKWQTKEEMIRQEPQKKMVRQEIEESSQVNFEFPSRDFVTKLYFEICSKSSRGSHEAA